MPGSRLRKVIVDLTIRYVSGDRRSPYFVNKDAWSREVTAEVIARTSESKQVANELFAVTKGLFKVRRAMNSAVEHPKDNKNKCADYHKHDESYSRCTQLQGYFTSLYCVNECHRLATCTLLA